MKAEKAAASVATGALAAFLKLAQAGRIAKGSFLIVESLDRITRSDVMTAFDLVRDIIKCGVKIVTLTDGQVYDADKISSGNFVDLIISLVYLSRANEESKTMSLRVGAAWAAKRADASNRKLTRRCVPWLRLSDDRSKFIILPERAGIVKRVFQMAADGCGFSRITAALNKDGIKPFGSAKHWQVVAGRPHHLALSHGIGVLVGKDARCKKRDVVPQ